MRPTGLPRGKSEEKFVKYSEKFVGYFISFSI